MMRFTTLLFSVLLLSGCQTGYYMHLIGGHSRLMNEREPVEQVLAAGGLDESLAERLARTGEMLDFAEQELALPAGRAYRRYVALDREWVVWNLMAAPEFSLEPFTWCYPVAGCNSYRGYFDLQRAERDARLLRARGYEVYGAGVVAYSTLGWFADPLTTPMLAGSEARVAELLFHELTHRRFWLRGDTRFNESLATAVGREGVRRWLVDQDQAETAVRMADAKRAQREVMQMVADTRSQLERLYQREIPASQKREGRELIIEALRERFRRAREENSQLARYDNWFAGPLNNAQLNAFNDYNQWVPAFNRLLLECGGHWSCFWERVEALADRPAEQRQRILDALAG